MEMARVKVGPLSSLPSGEIVEVLVGDKKYAVCNVDGELHAIDGSCPHLNGPIGQGALHGEMAVCPWHAWEFNCQTGENDRNPAVKLDTFPVTVEGDEIFIDV